MKPVFLIFILMFLTISSHSNAQVDKNRYVNNIQRNLDEDIDIAYLDFSRYIGGTKAYLKFIQENLKVPHVSLISKKSSVSEINIFIDSSGLPLKYTISSSECNTCDTEALNVVKKIKAWIPHPDTKYINWIDMEIYFTVEVQFPKWDLIKEQFKDTAIYYYRDEWEKHHPRKRKK